MGHPVREGETHIRTRRQALRAIGLGAGLLPVAGGTAAATICLAPAIEPDAELVRLGAEFDRAHETWIPLWRESDRLARQATAWLEAHPAVDFDAYCAHCTAIGSDAAGDASDTVLAQLHELADRIASLPAHGYAGLAAKARALFWDALWPSDYVDIADKDLGSQVVAFRGFIAELDRLAAEARS